MITPSDVVGAPHHDLLLTSSPLRTSSSYNFFPLSTRAPLALIAIQYSTPILLLLVQYTTKRYITWISGAVGAYRSSRSVTDPCRGTNSIDRYMTYDHRPHQGPVNYFYSQDLPPPSCLSLVPDLPSSIHSLKSIIAGPGLPFIHPWTTRRSIDSTVACSARPHLPTGCQLLQNR